MRGWLVFAIWTVAAPCSAQLAPSQVPPPQVLTLADALRIARASNPTRLQAEAVSELARGQSEAARAPLMPTVQGTAQYQRTTSNYVSRPSYQRTGNRVALPAPSSTTYDFFNFGVTITQLLYDFGKSINAFKASKLTIQAQEANEQVTRLSIDYSVRSAFFTARANKAAVSIAETTVSNQEKHLAQIKAFAAAGTRPEIDLAAARTSLAKARVSLIQARSTYLQALAALNQAMGVEQNFKYEIADETLPAVAEEGGEAAALLKVASEKRPELRVLALQADALQLTERSTWAQYAPSIGATGALTDAGTKLSELSWNWYVGAQATWTPWAGGIVRANLRQARANLMNVTAQLEILRQQVLMQLEQARVAIEAGKQVLDATAEVVEAAREQFGLAEGRYQAGVGNVIELEDAILTLATAQNDQVQAEYNLALARAQLLNALGRAE